METLEAKIKSKMEALYEDPEFMKKAQEAPNDQALGQVFAAEGCELQPQDAEFVFKMMHEPKSEEELMQMLEQRGIHAQADESELSEEELSEVVGGAKGWFKIGVAFGLLAGGYSGNLIVGVAVGIAVAIWWAKKR